MKLILMSFLLSVSAWSIDLKFIGPCEKEPIITIKIEKTFSNVGALTLAALNENKIPYQGTEEGLNSIFNTPTGLDAVEIISDIEMRSFGWCYSVDGVSPEIYPHEMPITKNTKTVIWHYGFAHFYNGEWRTQCTPSYSVRPRSLCH